MPFFADHDLHPFYRKNPKARTRFIGLVGGCSNKRVANSSVRGRDLYRGALAQMSIRWLDRNCEQWYLLSPKYHLLEPDRVVAPYKGRISDLNDDDKIAWAQTVSIQLKEKVGFKTPFVILAGAEFADALHLPEEFRLFPEFKIYDPTPRMMMGLRMNWIRSNPVMSKAVVHKIKHGES